MTASASLNGVSGPIWAGDKAPFVRILRLAFVVRPSLPFGHHQLKEAA